VARKVFLLLLAMVVPGALIVLLATLLFTQLARTDGGQRLLAHVRRQANRFRRREKPVPEPLRPS
jgi:hypothetical protein